MSKLIVPVSSQDHILGDEKASITLVEYGDYECPYCGAAYPIVKRIQKHFGTRLRFVFRNFPLVESHPHAGVAAISAEFAATKNKFWEMHDLLYENQENLDIPDLLDDAKSLSSLLTLKLQLKRKCLAKNKNDFMGESAVVLTVPNFFINGIVIMTPLNTNTPKCFNKIRTNLIEPLHYTLLVIHLINDSFMADRGI